MDPVKVHIDDKRSWMVAIAGTWILTIFLGVIRSSGVYFVHVMRVMKVSREEASVPFTIQQLLAFFMGGVLGILGGAINMRRTLIIAIAICAATTLLVYFVNTIQWLSAALAIANGICGGPVIIYGFVIPNQYFLKYRAVVNGILFSALSFGSIVLPPAIQQVINVSDFHFSFLFVGGLIVTMLPCSFLLVPQSPQQTPNFPSQAQKSDNNNSPLTVKSVPRDKNTDFLVSDDQVKETNIYGEKSNEMIELGDSRSNYQGNTSKDKKNMVIFREIAYLLKKPMTWIILQSFLLGFWISTIFSIVIVDHAKDCGVDLDKAPFVMSAFAGAEIIGRLSSGFVVKMIATRHVIKVAALVLGIAFIILPVHGSLAYLICIAVTLGFGMGVMQPASSVAFIEYLGVSKLAMCIGLAYILISFLLISFTFLLPFIRDSFGSYAPLFYLTGAMGIISSAIWLLEYFVMRRHQNSVRIET